MFHGRPVSRWTARRAVLGPPCMDFSGVTISSDRSTCTREAEVRAADIIYCICTVDQHCGAGAAVKRNRGTDVII